MRTNGMRNRWKEGKRKKYKAVQCPGYLTVFLTMCLTCLVFLCFVLIQGIVSNTVKTESQIAADIGMNSILAEYHRELYERYDLLFVDTAYGTAVPSIELTCRHLEEYLEKNLSGQDLWLGFLYQDLLNMKTKNVEINGICIASDEGGKVLRRQAVEYMYDKTGVTFLEEISAYMDVVNQYNIGMHKLTEMREETASQLEAVFGSGEPEDYEAEESEEDNSWSEEIYQNIMFQRDGDILNLCMMIYSDDYGEISQNQVDISQYLSARTPNQGDGMNPQLSYDEGIIEKYLFLEYLLEKTGNYRNPAKDAPLQYQTEYLIGGQDSDIENLAAVISELLLIRQAANITYILMDESKMEMIQAVAEVIAALLEAPGSEIVVEAAIVLYWGFWESIFDVRTLLAGGTVPLIKTEADWFLDMDALMDPDNYFRFATPMYETGLSYEEYLRMLLLFRDTQTQTLRFMDIVEMDIRQTPGNEHFRMDGCADSIRFNVQIEAKNGRSYNIVRWCGYY